MKVRAGNLHYLQRLHPKATLCVWPDRMFECGCATKLPATSGWFPHHCHVFSKRDPVAVLGVRTRNHSVTVTKRPYESRQVQPPVSRRDNGGPEIFT